MSTERPARDPLIDAATYFASLSEQLHSEPVEAVTLERICQQALDVVPTGESCGITLRRRRGRLETVVSTDELATRCDALQYDLGEGPCLEAATDHGAFVVNDTGSDPRWPRWGPRATEEGMRSLLAVQLYAPQDSGGDVLGAINIYSTKTGAYSREDLDRALIFSTHAASALRAAQVIGGLETAVHSRHLIGIAQGILMQRYGLSVDRSFEALRRYSNEANMKLSAVAEMVVQQRGLTPTSEAPGAADAPT